MENIEYIEAQEIGYGERILIEHLKEVIDKRLDFYGYCSKEFIDQLKKIVEEIE